MTAARLLPYGMQRIRNDIKEFEAVMRRKVHYVIKPEYLWSSIARAGPHAG